MTGYQALGVPFQLSAASMGQPSYADAIAKGLRNAGLGMEVAAKPSQLAEQLLAAKLSNHINSTKAKYAEPKEQAGLHGMDLANQLNEVKSRYAEPNAIADLNQKNAQLGLNPLHKQLLQAQINSLKNKDFKSNMIMELLRNPNAFLNGNQSNTPNTSEYVSSNEGESNDSNRMQKGNLLASLLGIKPFTQVVDGKLVNMNPLTGLTQTKVGSSGFEKELQKGAARQIENTENAYMNSLGTQDDFDSLSKIVSNPMWDQMRQHPNLGRLEIGYLEKNGTPEQQALIANYRVHAGNIIKNASRDFKGTFRVGEQQLLEEMKPSTSDTAEVARSKIESLSTLNKSLQKRAMIAAQLMRKGTSPIDAYKQAKKETNTDTIRDEVHKLTYPNVGKGQVNRAPKKPRYFIDPATNEIIVR